MQEFITIPISLVRELSEDKPYSKIGAYIDILNMADENGEIHMSERKLSDRWKWSRRQVRTLIDFLEERTIIEPKTNQKRTTIKLINTNITELRRTKNEPKANHKKEEDTEIYKRIIEHLNMVCGTNYRHNTESSQKDIRARLNEGYKEDDFYIVIDKKAKEWIGTEQEKYLRPMTLFGTKFESYLNQTIVEDKNVRNTYIDTIKNRVSDVDNW